MVRKLIYTLVFVAGVLQSSGQDLRLLNRPDLFSDSKAYFEIQGGLDVRSNAFTNHFMDRMIFGGFIDENLKRDVSDRLIDQNRLGIGANGKISYLSLKDSLFSRENLGIALHLEQRFDGFASFTDDLFTLSFYGNSDFLGQEADLSRSYASWFTYQKYGFGIFDKRHFSSISLSMVNGQNFIQAEVPEASLYTSQDADSLLLSYQGEMALSDTANSGFWNTNGIGLALDLQANIPLKEDGGFIHIELNNIGFISWYNTTHHFEADSNFLYTGVDLVDILDDDYVSSGVPALKDTLDYTESQSGKRTVLPGSAEVYLMKRLKEKHLMQAGIRVMPNRAHIPMVYLGYNYEINSSTLISTRFTVGGYGNWRVGLGYERYWKDWYVRLWTEDLPGLLLRDLQGKNAGVSIGTFIGKKHG